MATFTLGAPSGGSSCTIETPEYPLSKETITNTLKSEVDDGYVLTRRKYTRAISKFTLKWTHLSGTHYALLDAHFQSAGGAAATWTFTHPQTSTEYTVRYKNDNLKFDLSVPGESGWYSGTIVLEEA
jgi:hypothetical protein